MSNTLPTIEKSPDFEWTGTYFVRDARTGERLGSVRRVWPRARMTHLFAPCVNGMQVADPVKTLKLAVQHVVRAAERVRLVAPRRPVRDPARGELRGLYARRAKGARS